MNFQEIIQFIKSGNNPEQMILSMLQTNSKNNPVMMNILQLAKQGNYKQIEQVARNLAQQRGVDFDKEFTNFRKTLGL
jgi:hypothetical protein